MLQTHDGGPYTVDRVGSGGREKGGYTGRIKENHVVHSGGVQPSKLRKLIDKLDLTDDGYLQRFIPVILQPRQKGRRQPIGREVTIYEELIKHLAQVPGGAVDEATGLRRRHIVRLSIDAQRIAERVDERVLQLSKNDYLGDAYSSHVGRLTRMWGSLVLTLGHILQPRCDFIDAGPAELAETLIFEHVLDHITQFHLWLGSGAGEHMKQIASYILARQPRTNRLLLHHLTNDVRFCRGKGVNEIQQMISPLVSGNWLEPEDGGIGRRAKASWLINPRVYMQFGDELAREERYKRTEIHNAIRRSAGQPVAASRTAESEHDKHDYARAVLRASEPSDPHARAHNHVCHEKEEKTVPLTRNHVCHASDGDAAEPDHDKHDTARPSEGDDGSARPEILSDRAERQEIFMASPVDINEDLACAPVDADEEDGFAGDAREPGFVEAYMEGLRRWRSLLDDGEFYVRDPDYTKAYVRRLTELHRGEVEPEA